MQVQGGVDFSGCEMQDDGMCCVMREEEISTLTKDPVLECTHKSVEKCHYTYVTEFTPAQEEICEENFEKKCQITFKSMAVTETLKKCYRPLMKTCGNEATPSRLRFKRQQQTKRWNHHGGPVLSRAKRQLAGKAFLTFLIKMICYLPIILGSYFSPQIKTLLSSNIEKTWKIQ